MLWVQDKKVSITVEPLSDLLFPNRRERRKGRKNSRTTMPRLMNIYRS